MAKFGATKTAERRLAIELRKVAKIVGGIVSAYVRGGSIADPKALASALAAYSNALGPWGEAVAEKILGSVSANNRRAWEQASRTIGKELRSTLAEKILDSVSANNRRAWEQAGRVISKELRSVMAESAVGAVARQLQREQVVLIKSLPLEAGLRAQKLSQEAMTGGRRADEVAAELARTEEVTASRATLIARTEISKANAAITQARAQHVGVTHYIWQTSGDGDVRDTHADLQGKVFRFDDPPDIPGEGAHGPGEFPNCRCFAEPIIPE